MKNLLKIMIGSAIVLASYSTYGYSLTPELGMTIGLLNQKGVKVYGNAQLQTLPPAWMQMSKTGINKLPTDAQYRINRLPYDQDKSGFAYLVIPRLGVVSPIVNIPQSSKDYSKVIDGLSIDYNTYLQSGVVHYPSPGAGETGNMIIAGHSSYFKKDIGRYKNIFFTLPLLEFGDQIRVYVKNTKGVYERFRYMVHLSFETKPDDLSVIKPSQQKIITLFTCVPIGTAKSRWVVQAKLLLPPKKIIRK